MSTKHLALLLLVAISPFLAGCWRHSELARQEEGVSYLKFLGSTSGVELVLDGSERMELGGPVEGGKEGVLWTVLPGRHLVVLYRGDAAVLKRDLYAGPGQVLEIAVP